MANGDGDFWNAAWFLEAITYRVTLMELIRQWFSIAKGHDMTAEWKTWFAWYPVRLLTAEWAWLRHVRYREGISIYFINFDGYDYANL